MEIMGSSLIGCECVELTPAEKEASPWLPVTPPCPRHAHCPRRRFPRPGHGDRAPVVGGCTTPGGAAADASAPGPGSPWAWACSGRTPPFPAPAEPRPPGTLQSSARGGAASRALRWFPRDTRVTFAGYNVQSDRRMLLTHHGLAVATALELRGANGMGGGASMEPMATRGCSGSAAGRSSRGRLSKWHGATLSKKQVSGRLPLPPPRRLPPSRRHARAVTSVSAVVIMRVTLGCVTRSL
ncbi:hypothetical protein EJB05_40686, partial [Eragrostis curvula]